ncbi:hypothetical protein DFJ58DRAFT_745990 [Suillus subalutaceus]|uniref:uncharacterized protein n=1 Tax=Suillus subalutaceus TaxID=48586 RepID=UPI001B85C3CB|nr:uncharacterized protein DFJ58DRAFT_745990 [Suillus subalutaceus]KAG1852834.1 hypothetical protein DFJ58DRAFT_745990 [Suillus subalutaceus]
MRKEYYSQYSPVDVVDDDDTKLLDSGIAATSPPPRSRFPHLWPWLSHGVLISITLVFFTLWAQAPSIDDVVLFSPANEAVESIGIVKFNGSFGATSIYRGSPSPELDAAWDSISFNARPIRMTLEQLLRTGEKPSPSMARYPDEYGGGYMATVEAIHQLHCLDMLRRVSWGDHYYHNGNMHESPEEFRTHIDHCIEMLRQLTMCAGDTTMITHDWVEGRTTPFADFNVHHQCRNFEKVLNWVDEHRVFVPKSEMVRLDDNVDLPSPP